MKTKHPEGYRFAVEPYFYGAPSNELEEKSFVVKLVRDSDDEEIGYVEMLYDKQPGDMSFVETHCALEECEQGKGLGVCMYARAISVALKRGFTVKSSLVPSEDAQRVWKSKRLNALFDIELVDERFVIKSERRS